MKKQFDAFIDYSKFENYTLLEQNDSTLLITSNKKASPNKKYFFKIFNFECYSTKSQNIILDIFQQISSTNCQYLLSYKYIYFSFPFEESSEFSNLLPLKYTPTFSMRYFSLNTLKNALKDPKYIEKWKFDNYMNILFAVAEGMSYLHDHLICHGNLCPSNIVIDEANQFYVSDFGLFPIKKLYNKEQNLFNEIYKDPNMENNEPTFKNDIYSFGILICDVFRIYYQSLKRIKPQKLGHFIKKSIKDNFNLFPSFFSNLIQSCLNESMDKRPTFRQIINLFQTENKSDIDIKLPQLYNEFIQLNYIVNLAEAKDAYSLNKLGKMHENGIVFKKDMSKACDYYYKAVVLEYSEAQNNYGLILLENSQNDDANFYEGLVYLRLSAEKGNIHGMGNYGMLLLNGEGKHKNIEKGKKYLKKSADLGYSYAQANYGYALLQNNPSPSEIQEAIYYIRKSMSQNNAFSFFIYGILIEEGKIYDINYDLAFDNFKTALAMGYDQAKIKCDEYIENGKVNHDKFEDKIIQNKMKRHIIMNINDPSKDQLISLYNEYQSKKSQIQAKKNKQANNSENNNENESQNNKKSTENEHHNAFNYSENNDKEDNDKVGEDTNDQQSTKFSQIKVRQDFPNKLQIPKESLSINSSKINKNEKQKNYVGIKKSVQNKPKNDEDSSFVKTLSSTTDDLPFIEISSTTDSSSSSLPEEYEEELLLENPVVSESLKSSVKTSSPASPSTKGFIGENSKSNFNQNVEDEKNQKEISSITKSSIIKGTLSSLSSSDSSIEEIFPTENYQENSVNQRKRKVAFRRKPNDNEIEWNSEDRDNLIKFITSFGWDRWDNPRLLTSLRKPVQKIKLAARAFLRKLISYLKDPTSFQIALTILNNSMSKQFDPSFLNEENSEEIDNDFMNTPVMLDDEFVQTMKDNYKSWVRRIEILYYVNKEVRKSNFEVDHISTPEVEDHYGLNNWTADDDKCLIFGTWKYGYGNYNEMLKDDSIPFSYIKNNDLTNSQIYLINIRLGTIAYSKLPGEKDNENEENFADSEEVVQVPKHELKKQTQKSLKDHQNKKATNSKKKSPKNKINKDEQNYDESLIEPIKISHKLTIISLGHIVTDREGFHNSKYIFPAGFKSSRLFWSCTDKNRQMHYICEIIDDGQDSPLFRVTVEENNEIIFEGRNINKVCKQIVDKVIIAQRKKQFNVFGPEYFGISMQKTVPLIEQLPGIEKCANYKKTVLPDQEGNAEKREKMQTRNSERLQSKEQNDTPYNDITKQKRIIFVYKKNKKSDDLNHS